MGREPIPDRTQSLVSAPCGAATTSGINSSFPELFRSRGQVAHVLLTLAPLSIRRSGLHVRLACLIHAASVHSEPGSNSPSQKVRRSRGTASIVFDYLHRLASRLPRESQGASRDSRRGPHRTVQFSKNPPGSGRPAKGRRSESGRYFSVRIPIRKPEKQLFPNFPADRRPPRASGPRRADNIPAAGPGCQPGRDDCSQTVAAK